MKAFLFYFFLAAGFLGADESLIYLNEILREVEKDLDDNYRHVIDGSLLLPDDPANYLLYERLETHLKELEIKLSNNRGEIIAMRRFKPEEYLTNNSKIKNGMEPELPISILLETAKPQKEITTFQFDFL